MRVGISDGLRFGENKCISWPPSPGVQCGQWHKANNKHGGAIDALGPSSLKQEVVANRRQGHKVSYTAVGELELIGNGGFGLGSISQLRGFAVCTKYHILWDHSLPSTSCDASHTQYMDVRPFLGRVGLYTTL